MSRVAGESENVCTILNFFIFYYYVYFKYTSYILNITDLFNLCSVSSACPDMNAERMKILGYDSIYAERETKVLQT